MDLSGLSYNECRKLISSGKLKYNSNELNNSFELNNSLIEEKIEGFEYDQKVLLNHLSCFLQKKNKTYFVVYEYLREVPDWIKGPPIVVYQINDNFSLSTLNNEKGFLAGNINMQFVSGQKYIFRGYEGTEMYFKLLGFVEGKDALNQLIEKINSGDEYEYLLNETFLISSYILRKIKTNNYSHLDEIDDYCVDEAEYEERLKNRIRSLYHTAKSARK